MPWEGTIVNGADREKPLGSRSHVIERFAETFPGQPLEASHGPSAEYLAEMPEFFRAIYAKPRPPVLDVEFVQGSVQFFAIDAETIDQIGVEVRGNGNPLPLLAELCRADAWVVVNNADGSKIDLASGTPAELDQFRRWRDNAIAGLKSASSGEEKNNL